MAKSAGGTRNIRNRPAETALGVAAPPVYDSQGRLVRHLKALEDNPEFFNRSTERVYVFNQDGTQAFTISQYSDKSVEIPQSYRDRFKDKIVLHNHPSGNRFSTADVLMGIQVDAYQIRVTGKDGTYILTRPPNGWPFIARKGSELKNMKSTSLKSMLVASMMGWGAAAPESWGPLAEHWGAGYVFVPRKFY